MTTISTLFDGIFDRQMEDRSVERNELTEVRLNEQPSVDSKNYQLIHRNVDDWIHLAESFVKITLNLEKTDGTGLGAGANYALQNGATNLFQKAEIKFDSSRADQLEYPGLANQIEGLVKRGDDWKRTSGSSQMWFPDTVDGSATSANMGFEARKAYSRWSPTPPTRRP